MRTFCIALILLLCMSCACGEFAVVEEDTEEDRMEAALNYILSTMTLEQKIAQLFIVSPEALTGDKLCLMPDETLTEALMECPVGGVMLFGQNILDADTLSSMTGLIREAGLLKPWIVPLIGIDEHENNSVLRMKLEDMPESLTDRLLAFGFNLTMEPVLDLPEEDGNREVTFNSYGTDPEEAARNALQLAESMAESGIVPVFSHFPGIGDAQKVNTVRGYGSIRLTKSELSRRAAVPFRQIAGFDRGIVQVTALSAVQIEKNVPCCFSYEVVTHWLREELGWQGVVMTDSLRQPMITGEYKPRNVAVLALEAGCDLILLPADYEKSVDGVIQAVQEGRLTQERIEESVSRILRLKLTVFGR